MSWCAAVSSEQRGLELQCCSAVVQRCLSHKHCQMLPCKSLNIYGVPETKAPFLRVSMMSIMIFWRLSPWLWKLPDRAASSLLRGRYVCLIYWSKAMFQPGQAQTPRFGSGIGVLADSPNPKPCNESALRFPSRALH